MAASDIAANPPAPMRHDDFFSGTLAKADPEIDRAIRHEVERLQNSIELIASENIVSRAVLEAQGSVMTNKYAEGYPGKRYYGGCEFVDVTERLAIARAKELFSCGFANVQAHSGSQANQAAYMAVMQPGDTVLGMSLAGSTMRMTRTMMLEVLRQDFIRTAWSKGLRERIVILRHATRNALIPVVTWVGFQIPMLVGGAVVTETIFGLPGTGRLLVDALSDRDYPVVTGVALIVAAFVVLVNLLVDLTYAWLDPRARQD